MNDADRHARKQLLLARIAFERLELRREMDHVRQAVQLPQLLRAAVGGGFGRSLFGDAGAAGPRGWIDLALSMLRRHRVAATLIGGAAPLLRLFAGVLPWRRGRAAVAPARQRSLLGWRALLKVGVLGGVAYLGWRVARGRQQR